MFRLLISLVFSFVSVKAQSPDVHDFENLFSKNHAAIKFGVNFNNAHSEKITGDMVIKTPVGFGFNYAGFEYIINFRTHVGFKMGLNLGMQGTSFKNVFAIKNGKQQFERESMNTLGIESQYHFVTRFKINRNFSGVVEGGVDFRSYLNSTLNGRTIIYSPDSTIKKEFSIEIEYGTANMTPAIALSVGFLKLLKNGRLFRLSLISSISMIKMAEGYYHYTINDVIESSGEYYSNASYFGLEFGYVFTRSKK